MKAYKGLKVPEVIKEEYSLLERQINTCNDIRENGRCMEECEDCIFTESNLKIFEQWEKENGRSE